jgi:hypothetical protein
MEGGLSELNEILVTFLHGSGENSKGCVVLGLVTKEPCNANEVYKVVCYKE